MEDPIKEVADMMENTKDEGWEKSLANKQVTFVVYREGDQLNFFRVVDRGDGTLTPLSESIRLEECLLLFIYFFNVPQNIDQHSHTTNLRFSPSDDGYCASKETTA